MRISRGLLVPLFALALGAAPAQGQDQSWQNKWYWGLQGGGYFFQAAGGQGGGTLGGHWLITAGRSALYVGFDQLILNTVTDVLNSGQTVTYGSGQRWQASILAIPTDNKLQIFGGGGFAIHRISDATTPSVFTNDIQAVDDASTKAFLVVTVGGQYRWSPRTALFAQYQFMPAANDFVIGSQQHAFTVGFRYVVTHSEEIVSTER